MSWTRFALLLGAGALARLCAGRLGKEAALAGLSVSRSGVKVGDDPYDRYTYTWADMRCQIIHRFILRSWALSGAGMGLPGFGPKIECLRCTRAWGTAWN